MEEKPKIGIVIDYSLRFPNFKENYNSMRKQILTGIETEVNTENKRDISERGFWSSMHIKDSEAYNFYEKQATPKENWGEGFDYTWEKYFYNKEHLNKFIEDWSFNLFTQASNAKKEDIHLINICQSKLCDVVLIDKCSHTRKIPNTFAFLSKLGIFPKQVIFVTESELEKTKENYIAIYNPFEDYKKVLSPSEELRKPTSSFLDWFMSIERLIKK